MDDFERKRNFGCKGKKYFEKFNILRRYWEKCPAQTSRNSFAYAFVLEQYKH